MKKMQETPLSAETVPQMLGSMNIQFISVVEIVVILAVCIFLWHGIKKVKKNFLQTAEKNKARGVITSPSHHFLMTLIPVAESFSHFVILVLGGVACLSVVNISVSPLFYLLSVLSVGISFGAKDIFTDIIRGILTLVEGKVALGNFVTINGSSGYVKSLTIRQIELQLTDGSIELFPFSQVRTIRNHSLGYCLAKSLFKLSPSADMKKFEELANETFHEMRENKALGEYINEKITNGPIVKVVNVRRSGIEVNVLFIINPDHNKIFESKFCRIMVDKLQDTNMLSDRE
ncbi:MAG: mechanosensitive ion channel [Holosporales bacterium]|jgi:small-conductance mechanosensitive channel|nr:mechanosensitive ion channel [Holosporales bacterium]